MGTRFLSDITVRHMVCVFGLPIRKPLLEYKRKLEDQTLADVLTVRSTAFFNNKTDDLLES